MSMSRQPSEIGSPTKAGSRSEPHAAPLSKRGSAILATGRWRLVYRGTGDVVVADLRLATSFLSRLLGLQFRPPLPAGAGVLLAPCDSIHTCFCFFAMDVVFLSSDGVVLDIRAALRPWRVVMPDKQTRCVLEMTAGPIDLRVGDQLALASDMPTRLPRALHGFPFRANRLSQ